MQSKTASRRAHAMAFTKMRVRPGYRAQNKYACTSLSICRQARDERIGRVTFWVNAGALSIYVGDNLDREGNLLHRL